MVALASNYLGSPVSSSITHQQQTASSSLDQDVNAGTALASNSVEESPVIKGAAVVDNGTRPGWSIPDAAKPLVAELAVAAMNELWQLCRPEETAWLACIDGSPAVLDYKQYIRKFDHSLEFRAHGLKVEATRETGLVMMSAINLVENLLDTEKWVEMFPCIISRAFTMDALSTGVAENRHGALQLMYAELHLLSPMVPTRELCFLRYCKQYTQAIWAVVDVSIDAIQYDLPWSQLQCRRRPSGYLIEGMSNGCSKVTVVDHVEYDDRPTNGMYRSLVNSGMAFGAQRWFSNLQRQCEHLAGLILPNTSAASDLHATTSASEEKSILKLAQRMCSNFCAGVSTSTMHTWTTLDGSGDYEIRVMTRKFENIPSEPNAVVLSAATSLWLAAPPEQVFDFLRDKHNRSEWDIVSNNGIVHEIAHLTKGQTPGNSVSLLQVNDLNSPSSNPLILQESATDVFGSIVVYVPVDIQEMNVVMQGGDPDGIILLPAGFVILPDGPPKHSPLQHQNYGMDPSGAGGSLLTVAFQILVSNMPSTKLPLESATLVNNLISYTVQKIKSALGCDKF